MQWLPVISAIQLIILAAVLVALVWLVIRRIRKKSEETFEKRDN